MKVICLGLVMCFFSACVPVPVAGQAIAGTILPGDKYFHLIQYRLASNRSISYLIDKNLQSCSVLILLSFNIRDTAAGGGVTMQPVSCDKLKANVPEAAAYITWGEESIPIPPPSTQETTPIPSPGTP